VRYVTIQAEVSESELKCDHDDDTDDCSFDIIDITDEVNLNNDAAYSSNANVKRSAENFAPRSKTSRKKKRKVRKPKMRRKSSQLSTENMPPDLTSRSVSARKGNGTGKNVPHLPEFTNSAALENGPSVFSESYAVGTKSSPVSYRKPPRPRKQYLCSECGRQMTSKSSLDIHVRTHTGDRPFMCPICGREFRANGNLTRHQVGF